MAFVVNTLFLWPFLSFPLLYGPSQDLYESKLAHMARTIAQQQQMAVAASAATQQERERTKLELQKAQVGIRRIRGQYVHCLFTIKVQSGLLPLHFYTLYHFAWILMTCLHGL